MSSSEDISEFEDSQSGLYSLYCPVPAPSLDQVNMNVPMSSSSSDGMEEDATRSPEVWSHPESDDVLETDDPASDDVLESDDPASADVPESDDPASADVPESDDPASADVPESDDPASADVPESDDPASADVPESDAPDSPDSALPESNAPDSSDSELHESDAPDTPVIRPIGPLKRTSTSCSNAQLRDAFLSEFKANTKPTLSSPDVSPVWFSKRAPRSLQVIYFRL